MYSDYLDDYLDGYLACSLMYSVQGDCVSIIITIIIIRPAGATLNFG